MYQDAMPNPTWMQNAITVNRNMNFDGDTLSAALSLRHPTQTVSTDGVTLRDPNAKNIDGFREALISSGWTLWKQTQHLEMKGTTDRTARKNYHEVLVCEEGVVCVEQFHLSSKFMIEVTVTNRATLDNVIGIVRDHFEEASKANTIFFITEDNNGLQLSAMTVSNAGPVDPENYTPEVLRAFEYGLKQLQAETPNGRILLFEGPPGTGKTFLVRALLNQAAEGTNFILIPPDTMDHIASPRFTKMLIEFCSTHTGPCTLILEDADNILVPRGMDNMSAISSLLNASDGILGSVLDLRIVATTNAKRTDIDPAIMRRGRLCKHIQVGPLPVEQARAKLARLIGDPAQAEARVTKAMTLGDVYALAADITDEVALLAAE